MAKIHPSTGFDQQVENLISKNYPQAAHLSEAAFRKLAEPLKEKLNNQALPEIDLENGVLPFVIVVQSNLVDAETMISKVIRLEKNGITKLFPHVPADFQTTSDTQLPDNPLYLLLDIDRGKSSLNIRPEDALVKIKKQQRLPLTIDEGIALVTQFPGFLIKNNCFSLLASRVPGNQRVPAIWINGEKHPNLGWCWDRNPHTWLGSASAKNRIG